MGAYRLSPETLSGEGVGAMDLAAHGIAWVGTRRESTPGGTIACGQAALEYFIPAKTGTGLPLLLIHGGGQGTDFMTRVDGGAGWLHHFVAQGRAVYVIDLPGHGRSPAHPLQVGETAPPMSFEMASAMFVAPEANPAAWPGAERHQPWPDAGDALESFVASSGPLRIDLEAAQRDGAAAVAAALDRIGPCVLVTHSAGGPIGWLAADCRPDLVSAILSLEPLGPPVAGMGPMALPWGVTAAPMTYDPPAAAASELSFVEQTPPEGLGSLQAGPARRLPNLAGIPIAIFTAEASWAELADASTAAFLAQAGCSVDHVRLRDLGVEGNGHLAMIEMNNSQSADALLCWLDEHGQ